MKNEQIKTANNSLKEAIRIIGGQKKVAELFGIKQQSVSKWLVSPPNRVIKLENATDHLITRYELRPDLYPRD